MLVRGLHRLLNIHTVIRLLKHLLMILILNYTSYSWLLLYYLLLLLHNILLGCYQVLRASMHHSIRSHVHTWLHLISRQTLMLRPLLGMLLRMLLGQQIGRMLLNLLLLLIWKWQTLIMLLHVISLISTIRS